MNKKHCEGCYCDPYNRGLGGSKVCWHLGDAKLVKRKRVGTAERPPWKRKPELLPDCYHATGWVFIDPEVDRW